MCGMTYITVRILGLSSDVVVNPDESSHSRGRVIDATTTCNANGHFHEDNEDCIELPSITELSRSPSSLVWLIPEKFERFVVHCVARWWGVVSFSKTQGDGDRVTHLLKPRLPLDKQSKHDALQTPPTSEIDSASEVASEAASDVNLSPSEVEDNEEDLRAANTSAAWADITDDMDKRVNIADGRTSRAAHTAEGDAATSDEERPSRDRLSRSRTLPEPLGRVVRDSDTEESDAERTSPNTSPNTSRPSTPRKATPKPASTHPWNPPTVSFADYLFESN